MKIVCSVCMASILVCRLSHAQLTGDIVNVHDPSIIKDDQSFYIFSTGTGIPIRRSADLKHWKLTGRVFETIPAWFRKEVPGFKSHIWAPDIHRVNGRYYLYYSVSTFGRNGSCIGLATNGTPDPHDPEYRWVDQGVVIRSVEGKDNWNAIDPNLVRDEAGDYWLAFGSFWTGIKLVKINPLTGKPSEKPPELIPIARRTKPTAVEAPFIVRRDGFYYLFVSFDQCCKGEDSTYKMMVGRSRGVEGPYKDRSGRNMMEGGGTLILESHGDCRGPGHNSVLKEGESYWLVHHMYDAANGGRRTLQIRSITWDDDGWPTVGG